MDGMNIGVVRARASRLAPAVSAGCVVLDFSKVRIEVAELVADALDCRTDVSPIAVIAASNDVFFLVQAVVDRAIGHVTAHVRHQEMDDFVLSLGEAHIGVVPVSPAHIGIKDEQIMGLAEERPPIWPFRANA